MKWTSVMLVTALLAQIIPLPCFAQEGVILKSGEIERSKLQVGACVWMSYRGKKGKKDTLKGYVKSADEEAVTVGEGFWKERIEYHKIVVLAMGRSPDDVARLKKTLEGPSRLSPRTKTVLTLVGLAIVGVIAGLLAQGESLGGEE